MEIVKLECFRPSAHSGGEVFTRAVRPADKRDIKATVQIAHGMSEHSLRYMELAELLAQNGFAVYANDHLGHGRSGGLPGYFGPRDGWNNIVRDMRSLYDSCIAEDAPGAPYFIIGHSMGSILVRSYMEHWGGTLSGAVLMGPPAPNAFAGLGRAVCSAYGKAKGDITPIPELWKAMQHSFSKHLANSEGRGWLTRDTAAVSEYDSDPMCGFPFTIGGYRDLCAGLKSVSGSDWAKNVPSSLPVHIMSGGEDGVTGCGKSLRVISERLEANGSTRVTTKLYDGARHDLLHELNAEEVRRDILEYLLSLRDELN